LVVLPPAQLLVVVVVVVVVVMGFGEWFSLPINPLLPAFAPLLAPVKAPAPITPEPDRVTVGIGA
jgi:hypothetical protein